MAKPTDANWQKYLPPIILLLIISLFLIAEGVRQGVKMW